LSRQHFDGDPQDASQQLFAVKFLRQRAGYFEEIITLSNTEIWEHGRILSLACLQNIRESVTSGSAVVVDKYYPKHYNPFKNAKSLQGGWIGCGFLSRSRQEG
jgi:hypothetical protein